MHSFDINIATEYGVNCAIIIQNLYYWIKKNEANEKHFHDGKYWTYSSVKAFEKLFPYWSSKQITSILHKLEESELIVSGNFNKSPYDRTKWYALTEKGNALFQKENSIFPKGEMKNTKRENENDQKGEPIPNIKTDINTNIKTDSECNFILKNINRKRYNKIDSGYTTDELVNNNYLNNMTKKMLFSCDNTGGHELSYNVTIYNSYGSLLSKNLNTNINIKNSSINMLNCGDKTETKAKNIDIRDSEVVGYPTPYATATGNTIISTNLKAYNNIFLSIIKDNVKIPPRYGHDGLIISLNNVSYDVSEDKDRFLSEVNINT